VLALELLHAGNTAIVSQQYSFLPSWAAFIVHRDRAAEAGRARAASGVNMADESGFDVSSPLDVPAFLRRPN